MRWLARILLTIVVMIGAYAVLQEQLTGGGGSTSKIGEALPNPTHIVTKIANWFGIQGQKAGQAAGLENTGKSKVYRWTDAEGVTHLGNVAPEGVDYEELWVDPNQSLQSLK